MSFHGLPWGRKCVPMGANGTYPIVLHPNKMLNSKVHQHSIPVSSFEIDLVLLPSVLVDALATQPSTSEFAYLVWFQTVHVGLASLTWARKTPFINNLFRLSNAWRATPPRPDEGSCCADLLLLFLSDLQSKESVVRCLMSQEIWSSSSPARCMQQTRFIPGTSCTA